MRKPKTSLWMMGCAMAGATQNVAYSVAKYALCSMHTAQVNEKN